MFSRFNRNMNSKADTNIYLLIIVLLAVLVCYLQPKLIFPALDRKSTRLNSSHRT